MMSTSNKSYKELSIPYFKEVFEIVDDKLKQFEIPYYLIGANAIALHFLEKGIKPSRGTADIDFAIMISNNDQFEEIINALQSEEFIIWREIPHRLLHERLNVVIDLLPFGEIEQDYTVNFDKRNIDLHVLGFKEAMEKPKEIAIEEKILNIPSIPGMVILKLIAYSDRPESRTNDLDDILKIIIYYFDLNYDEILEHHNDLLEIEPFDRIKIGAESLGRNVKDHLHQNNTLKDRVFTLTESNLKEKEKSKIARYFTQKGENWTIEYALEILNSFKRGLDNGK